MDPLNKYAPNSVNDVRRYVSERIDPHCSEEDFKATVEAIVEHITSRAFAHGYEYGHGDVWPMDVLWPDVA